MRMICVWLNRPSRLTLHTNPPPLELFQFFTFLTSLIIFSWFWIIIFLFIFLFFFFFFFRGGKREFRALFWPEKSALFESIRVAYIIPTHLLQPWLDGLKNTRHVPPLILPRKKRNETNEFKNNNRVPYSPVSILSVQPPSILYHPTPSICLSPQHEKPEEEETKEENNKKKKKKIPSPRSHYVDIKLYIYILYM
jgi:energy-coupling factor transporter transmembrane protein EcfT